MIGLIVLYDTGHAFSMPVANSHKSIFKIVHSTVMCTSLSNIKLIDSIQIITQHLSEISRGEDGTGCRHIDFYTRNIEGWPLCSLHWVSHAGIMGTRLQFPQKRWNFNVCADRVRTRRNKTALRQSRLITYRTYMLFHNASAKKVHNPWRSPFRNVKFSITFSAMILVEDEKKTV